MEPPFPSLIMSTRPGPLTAQISDWVNSYVEGQEKPKLPVLWIGGRSGCGKSVALLHVLAELHEEGNIVLFLRNRIGLLPDAVTWALTNCVDGRGVIISINDPDTPNTAHEAEKVWEEATMRLDDPSLGDQPGRFPFVVCCGPTEQGTFFQYDQGGAIEFKSIGLSDRVEDVPDLREWFKERTGEETEPLEDEENSLLIDLFFQWARGESLDSFARNLKNQIHEAGKNKAGAQLLVMTLGPQHRGGSPWRNFKQPLRHSAPRECSWGKAKESFGCSCQVLILREPLQGEA